MLSGDFNGLSKIIGKARINTKHVSDVNDKWIGNLRKNPAWTEETERAMKLVQDDIKSFKPYLHSYVYHESHLRCVSERGYIFSSDVHRLEGFGA